ncbi:MAG: NAD(P)-binding domain-containing protein [Oscillospiraceae bacterium]|nr:NAD(P)-binding domain-containing protein [Oscillospiraceae bacterium]
MKVALLVDRSSFEKYARWEGTGWELIHMGNGVPEPEKVIATGADVIVADAITKVGPEIIDNMPGLKLVHSQGVAFNAIDTLAAKDAGIFVCNTAGENARPVAEQTVLLMLSLLKSFRHNEDMIYADRQMEAKMACFNEDQPELYGLKAGIVGYGAIGRILASILEAFGCELCYYDTRLADPNIDKIPFKPLEELFAECDIISLHVPVTPETENMVNSDTLKLFKRGAILINTARGELIDNEAVAQALISGQLGGFGADTLAPEPFIMSNPIISGLPEEVRRRVALSPHIAGITAGFFDRAFKRIKGNIEAIDRNEKPVCIVNGL